MPRWWCHASPTPAQTSTREEDQAMNGMPYLKAVSLAFAASMLALAGGSGELRAQDGNNNGEGKADKKPLVIADQGSFSVGGRVVTGPGTFDATIPGAGSRNDGQEFRIDQLYAQFQVPVNARRLPIVMIHGGAGTGRVWETTPDGREG